MACLERDVLHLVSRNENEFASFGELADRMARELTHKDVIRDGELASLDQNGCSQFNALFFRSPCSTEDVYRERDS